MKKTTLIFKKYLHYKKNNIEYLLCRALSSSG